MTTATPVNARPLYRLTPAERHAIARPLIGRTIRVLASRLRDAEHLDRVEGRLLAIAEPVYAGPAVLVVDAGALGVHTVSLATVHTLEELPAVPGAAGLRARIRQLEAELDQLEAGR